VVVGCGSAVMSHRPGPTGSSRAGQSAPPHKQPCLQKKHAGSSRKGIGAQDPLQDVQCRFGGLVRWRFWFFRARHQRVGGDGVAVGDVQDRGGQATRWTLPGMAGTAAGWMIAASASTPSTSRGPGLTTMPSASIAQIGTPGRLPATARAWVIAPLRW